MKLLLQTLLLLVVAQSTIGQTNRNLELLSTTPIGEAGNDIWGYVDSEGTEYAIIGGFTATYIFSLEDPTAPEQVAVIPGASSIWRDMKSYRDHIYVTTDDHNAEAGEQPDGITIIDMSRPDSITHTKYRPFVNTNGASGVIGDCHNIYIDTIQGFCYLSGCQEVGQEGVLILDLKEDLKEPPIVGATNDRYTHDAFVQDDILYSADILAGLLTLYDITDKSSPVELGRANTSSFFTHNVWASADGNYAFTTDERPGGRVDAYDVSDPANIVRLDDYIPADRFADNAIPHNTHYLDGYLVTSWYTEGLVVLDANKPDNLVKVASYDTYLNEANIPANQAGRWFFGLWGAYPYLPSGLMLGGDINSGLMVWKPVQETNGTMADGFVRASYLEGTVTDAKTGDPISGVTVTILSEAPNTKVTRGAGTYKTGQVLEGEFMVEFNHPNYEILTVPATLASGEVTMLDVELNSTSLTISTLDGTTGGVAPWINIIVENSSSGFKQDLLIRESGTIISPVRLGETYSVRGARWGYEGFEIKDIVIEGDRDLEVTLTRGFEDDFFVDLGWTVESEATSGGWQRGTPSDQSFDGVPTQTSLDLPTDIGTSCYATGLGGSNAGANDIDGGATVLTSRTMNWSEFTGAKVSYHLFFSNVGGQGSAPNDSVWVRLTNGTETIRLPGRSESSPFWSDSIISVITPDDITFTSDMQIIFTAADLPEGHIVEAQLDGFKVEQLGTVSTADVLTEGNFTLYPNPARDVLQISRPATATGKVTYEVFTADGKLIQKKQVTDPLIFIDTDQWTGAGMYYLHITDELGGRQVEKVVKI